MYKILPPKDGSQEEKTVHTFTKKTGWPRLIGKQVWAHDEKQRVLQDFFQDLIGKKIHRTQTFQWPQLQLNALVQLPGLELDRPFTENEIQQAIKDLPSEKAPGPDGFTSDFYKHCWEIIKPDVLSAFHAFYIHHNEALEHLNRA